jgi:DNA-binding beta-propeller fold protein YncE
MKNTNWKQETAMAALALIALFGGSGCNRILDQFFQIDPEFNFSYNAEAICRCENLPGGGKQLVRYVPALNGDGTLEKDIVIPVDNCNEYTGNDDNRGNTMSEPVTSGSTSGSNANIHAAAASASVISFQDQYPLLSPLPFVPQFSSIVLGSRPPIACNPNTSVYLMSHDTGVVNRYRTCPFTLAKTINVGTNPLQLGITPDAKTLIVTRYDNSVVFIDTATDTITTDLHLSSAYPNGLAISPDGSTAYVTNFVTTNPSILTIDIASRTVTRTTQVNTYPKSIYLTPDGAQAWVLFSGSSTIYVLDVLTMTVVSTLDAGGIADTAMAFNPTGTRAYVSATSNQLVVFDTAILTKVASITICNLPSDVLVSPDGSVAYVNSQVDSVLSIVNLKTNTLIANAPVGGPASGLQFIQ